MIAESRDMPAGMIPDWWEMDDADLSEMLIELRFRDEHPDIHAQDETA